MRFDRRKSILVGTIIVVVLITGLWVGSPWRTSLPIQKQYHELRSAQPSPSPGARSALSPVAVANAITTPIGELERQKAIEQIEATSIVFFGKVLDQHDSPVVGAHAIYTVHHLNFRGNIPIEGPMTDDNGRFEIRAQGPSITVSVSHPQFYQGKDAERQVDYSNTIIAPPFLPRPTRESPTLFKLVRKAQAETVIHVPSKEVRLPLDGRSVEVNLGAGSQTVRISLHSTSVLMQNEFQRFDWSLALAVPNGGLVERLDSLDFQAPEIGYVPAIEIQMVSTRTPRWSSRVSKEYFVRFENGRYGRFQLLASGETGFCRFESYFNPSGSRNLEVDPAKIVTSSVSRNN